MNLSQRDKAFVREIDIAIENSWIVNRGIIRPTEFQGKTPVNIHRQPVRWQRGENAVIHLNKGDYSVLGRFFESPVLHPYLAHCIARHAYWVGGVYFVDGLGDLVFENEFCVSRCCCTPHGFLGFCLDDCGNSFVVHENGAVYHLHAISGLSERPSMQECIDSMQFITKDFREFLLHLIRGQIDSDVRYDGNWEPE